MNTGIQDAFDLGWKLAAVLRGWGGPALLESYDSNAGPHRPAPRTCRCKNYRRLVSAAQRAEINAATPEGDAARRAIGESLVQENERSWQPIGVHLGYIYHPSPIVVSDDSVKPEDDTFGYRPTTFPGARAPHVWLYKDQSTLDLFGDGFVLLKFADVATDALERDVKIRGVPLRIRRIDHPDAAALYERALVLVRPDGHVAWRGDRQPADSMTVIDVVRGAGPLIAARRSTGARTSSTR